MALRHKHVTRLPSHVPPAHEVAKELAEEILRNIDAYRLRHKPVIKVTSNTVYGMIVRRYNVPPSTAVGAFTAFVLNYLDHELEKHGLKLIAKIETSKRKVKARFYQLPG